MRYFYLIVYIIFLNLNIFSQYQGLHGVKEDTNFQHLEKRIVLNYNNRFIPITMLVTCPYFWAYDYSNIYYGHKQLDLKYTMASYSEDCLRNYGYDTLNIDTVESYFINKGNLCNDTSFVGVKRNLLYSILLNSAGLSNISKNTLKNIRIVFPQNFDRKYFYIVSVSFIKPDSVVFDYVLLKAKRIDKYDVINKFSFSENKKVINTLNKRLYKIDEIIKCNECLSNHDYIETESLFESNIDGYKYNFLTINFGSDKSQNKRIKNYYKLIELLKWLPYGQKNIKIPDFK